MAETCEICGKPANHPSGDFLEVRPANKHDNGHVECIGRRWFCYEHRQVPRSFIRNADGDIVPKPKEP